MTAKHAAFTSYREDSHQGASPALLPGSPGSRNEEAFALLAVLLGCAVIVFNKQFTHRTPSKREAGATVANTTHYG